MTAPELRIRRRDLTRVRESPTPYPRLVIRRVSAPMFGDPSLLQVTTDEPAFGNRDLVLFSCEHKIWMEPPAEIIAMVEDYNADPRAGRLRLILTAAAAEARASEKVARWETRAIRHGQVANAAHALLGQAAPKPAPRM